MIFRSRRRTAGVVAVVTVTVFAVLAGCGAPPPPPPRTARVERATVRTGVSAAGSVASSGQANLGFQRGGQLTAVDAKVGDTVRAGQVLATIDNFPALQALRQAQSGLAGQLANLERVRGSTAVGGANNSVAQAQRILDATKRSVAATVDADNKAVGNAQAAYDKAQAGAAQAQQKFAADQAMCMQAQAMMSSSSGSTGSTGSSGSASGSTSTAMPISCTLLPGDQSAVTMSQSGVGMALSTLQQAQGKRETDKASGQVQIEQARNGVVMAQNQLDSSSADRSPNLDAAQAAVDGARVGVSNAQRDLANTTLRAPVDGRITALNGAVGEFLGASTSTTPFAPGGGAPIPGAATDAGAGAAAGAAGGAGASPTRPGGTQFIVEQNVSGFSVVAPFQENDATMLQPGQRAEFTVDALPDAMLGGTVTSVAPSSTAISGVINYYVTISVDQPDPRLREGQSARASVITGEAANMLSVPNAAVTKQGDRSSVIVLGSDGRTTPTPFTPGLVGPDRTQVAGGLSEGQQVVETGNQ